MKLVVDASVAAKWLFAEPHTVDARRVLGHRIDLYAPSLLLVEVANVIWKKARRREILDAQPYLLELTALTDMVTLRSSAALIASATATALTLGHPVYDCLYIVCAEIEGVPLVTADKKLQEAAKPHAVDIWHIGDEDAKRRIAAAGSGNDKELGS